MFGSCGVPQGSELYSSDRKDNSTRLVRILQHDGLFGFCEPFTFSSVPELIAHHQQHTLAHYNPTLDVTLTLPVSRRTQVHQHAACTTLNTCRADHMCTVPVSKALLQGS